LIPESVTEIDAAVFRHCSSLTVINCVANSQPAGWNANWNKYCNAEVVFGYQG